VALVCRHRRPSPRRDGRTSPPVLEFTADVVQQLNRIDEPLIVLEIGDAPAAPIRAQLRAAGFVVSTFTTA